MPTIFQANMDGTDAVRYFHISLVGTYFSIARDNASAALICASHDARLRHSIIAVAFSAMSLEAFANEVAEDVIGAEDRVDFLKLKGRFKNPRSRSSVVAKLEALVAARQWAPAWPPIIYALEQVIDLRNSLVHYKLAETAGKVFLPPAKAMRTADGQVMWGIGFVAKPTRIDPPFLSRVTPMAAAQCFNATHDFFSYWMAADNQPESMKGFAKLPIPQSTAEV